MMLLLSSLLYAMSFNAVAGPDNELDSTKKQEYEHYMQRSKNQRTAATILVAAGAGGGLITVTVALLATLGDVLLTAGTLGYYKPEKRTYTLPLLLSGAIFATGIIFFTAAAKNKKIAKGISMSAGVGNTSLLQQQQFKSYAYPALSLKIGF